MRTRLQHFLQAENLTPSRFADQIGIQRSSVSHVLSGRNNPGFDFIESMLLSYPSLNAEWLITGKGKLYKELKTASLFDSEEAIPQREAEAYEKIPEKSRVFTEEIVDPQVKTVPEKPITQERKLVKALLFYSDNTFTELSPEE